eukprot:693518-Hanusia_phi.AAC.1
MAMFMADTVRARAGAARPGRARPHFRVALSGPCESLADFADAGSPVEPGPGAAPPVTVPESAGAAESDHAGCGWAAPVTE